MSIFKKTPKIIITFDKVYGFPEAKAKYCSKEQFADAALFMVGKNHEYGRRKTSSIKPAKVSHQRRRKENVVHKFFRILFTRERAVEFPLNRAL